MNIKNKSSLEDYIKLEKIGEGTYGVVYKARHKESNRLVAMKKIRLDTCDEGIPSTSLREISILKEICCHPNIVDLEDTIVSNTGKLYLIFEFMAMDLRKYMDRIKGNLDPMLIMSYTYQVCRALEFCHSRRIIHRDLKPQNLLIDNTGLIKIADFGLARTVSVPLRVITHEVVTMWYRCPEVLLGIKKYSHHIDMWSIGCIFGEMICKKPIFRGDSEIDQLFSIFKILGTPTTEIWSDLKKLPDFKPNFPQWPRQDLKLILPQADENAFDLFQKLLLFNPIDRIIARDALKHPYFKSFDASLLPRAPPSFYVGLNIINESDQELSFYGEETSPIFDK